MKLTVLTWLRDSSITFLGRTIEIIFRIILFLTPLGVFLLLIQMRDKASTIRTISVYTEDGSVWQHIFPGFILVSVDPKSFKKSSTKIKNKISFWIANNKYILTAIFMLLVVFLLLIGR